MDEPRQEVRRVTTEHLRVGSWRVVFEEDNLFHQVRGFVFIDRDGTERFPAWPTLLDEDDVSQLEALLRVTLEMMREAREEIVTNPVATITVSLPDGTTAEVGPDDVGRVLWADERCRWVVERGGPGGIIKAVPL